MEKTKILDLIVPGYTDKFLSGQFGLDEMPLLEAIGNRFSPDMRKINLSNVYIVACQHLLKPQLAMFKLFVKLGITPSQILILPKIYSTNESILSQLKDLGCKLFEDALTFDCSENFDSFHSYQSNQVVDYVSTVVPKNSKLIILDDGGMLIKTFVQRSGLIKSFKGRVYGVEQTASGKNVLLSSNLPFIVTSVASSIEKITIETDYIIRHTMKRIEEYFLENEISLSAKILVLGMGPIGKTMMSVLAQKGYQCSGYDIIDGRFKGVLSDYDIIIGATGKNSLKIQQLVNLKDNVHLVSISSSDREFPSVHIRNNSISGEHVHDTFVYGEKNIHLANGGFPITFKGCEVECFPVEMDVTKMKLTESVLLHIISKTEIITSVNEIYREKKLLLHTNKLYVWGVFIGIMLTVKIIFFGFLWIPPVWAQFVFLFSFLAGSIPAIWQIIYLRRVENFIVKAWSQ